MLRRIFLFWTLILSVGWSDVVRKPNIILILVDDMGWMDCGAYGSQYYETPNIDRFATQAMRFTDAYAMPLCSPTRASIMTGQYSSRHGVTTASGHKPPLPEGTPRYPEKASPSEPFIFAKSKNYLDPEAITIAEVLRDAGYRTGHFGKWHLGLLPPYRPDKQGFETTWQCAPDPGPPSYFSPYGVYPDGKPSGKHKVGNITDGPPGEHITDRLTDEAIKFIEAHRNEPFYLNMWHYSVHGPWQHKVKDTARFAKKTDPRGLQGNPVMASMLKCVDDSLGRIMEKLDELKLAENTLVIFYSDNGGNTHSWTEDDPKIANVKPGHPRYKDIQSYRKWAGNRPPTNNAPLRNGKGSIYEGGQRVPLMVRWPGHIQPGSVCHAVVGPIDLYPTILDAVGLQKPAGHIIDGVSLMPLLLQTGTIEREAYFTWFNKGGASVRKGDYKLIRLYKPEPAVELYNLKNDIGETHNLAEKMPEKVNEMQMLLDNFLKETGALVPKPNPVYRPRPKGVAGTNDDPALGLVPKKCKMELVPGALRVEGKNKEPFLGTAKAKLRGPITLTLRMRSATGGIGQVRWITTDKEKDFSDYPIVKYKLSGGNQWQNIQIDLPVKGMARIIRLYLPAEQSPVEIQLIQYAGRDGKKKTWDFSRVK